MTKVWIDVLGKDRKEGIKPGDFFYGKIGAGPSDSVYYRTWNDRWVCLADGKGNMWDECADTDGRVIDNVEIRELS